MRFLPACGAAILAAFLVSFPRPVQALRVMTYNLFTMNAGSSREPHFEAVLQYAQPDLLVVQEITSQAAVDYFRNAILDDVNPGEWSSAQFTDGIDSDNALFYRTAKVEVLSHSDIETAVR